MPNREILEGQTINNLYIDKYLGDNKYECKCKLCGNTRICRSYELKKGKYKACKECEKSANGKYEDLTGKQFGYWVCLRRDNENDRYWICRCNRCGKNYKVLVANMKNGKSKSCVDCANELKQDNSILKKQFKKGRVIKRLQGDTWECECGICKKIINRAGTRLKNQDTIVCNNCSGELLRTDITGKTIGNWEVLEYVKNTEDYHSEYICKCKLCGKITNVFTYNLTSGHSQSCGCQSRIDLTGKKINEWTVIKYMGDQMWECECSCGKIGYVHGFELRTGRAKSCGCKKWEYTRKTLLNKYGDIAPCKIGNARTQEQIELAESKEKLENKLKSMNTRPTTYEVSKLLNLGISRTLKILHMYNLDAYVDINSRHSRQEKEILEFLYTAVNKEEVVIGDRSILSGKELDIYLPEYKVAIEFNGNYWHSSIYKSDTYHQEKTIACAKKGIRLIHIFEYEWEDESKQEKIKEIVLNALDKNKARTVYARNTTIKLVEKEEAELFLNKYHLQGYANAKITLGCYTDNELIGVMSFGLPRFNKNYEYELIRLCWKQGVNVVGGLEKMFKHFEIKFKPKSIITYCDISKFTGNSYTKIGFSPLKEKPITVPNYIWLNTYTNDILSRYQTQKSRLVKMGLGSINETESEIMNRNEFLKICDCGNIRLEWSRV